MSHLIIKHNSEYASTNPNTPKAPTTSSIVEGELALNNAKGVETIFTKNNNNEIVSFSSDAVFDGRYASKSSEHTHNNKSLLDTYSQTENNLAKSVEEATYNSSFRTLTTLSSVNPNIERLIFVNISANQTLSLSEALTSGHECHIIVVNTTNNKLTITMPSSLNSKQVYYNGVKGDSALEIEGQESGEINIITNGDVYFVRFV